MQIKITEDKTITIVFNDIKTALANNAMQIENKDDYLEVKHGNGDELSGAEQTIVLAVSYIESY